jgi:hypothetical protein
MAQVLGTFSAVGYALIIGFAVYLALKYTVGIRLSRDEELQGCDISIHRIGAYPEQEFGTGSPVLPEYRQPVYENVNVPLGSKPVVE